jgi:hypothetical protein
MQFTRHENVWVSGDIAPRFRYFGTRRESKYNKEVKSVYPCNMDGLISAASNMFIPAAYLNESLNHEKYKITNHHFWNVLY